MICSIASHRIWRKWRRMPRHMSELPNKQRFALYQCHSCLRLQWTCSQSNSKTKDSQLKRAAETISRFKTQLQDAQLQIQVQYHTVLISRWLMKCVQGGAQGDKARLEAAEACVKVLEKQRAELLEGFRKQMKLIDILKRQKVRTVVRDIVCCCWCCLFIVTGAHRSCSSPELHRRRVHEDFGLENIMRRDVLLSDCWECCV